MGLHSKSDSQVEKIHKNAEKEGDYKTKHQAAREMEDRGYEYGGFSGWTKKEKEQYVSEPLPVRENALTPYLLSSTPFIAMLLMNPFIAVIYALLVPFASHLFFKNRFIKDVLSLIPLYFFLGLWSLALLPFRFLPGILKSYYNINVFSMAYSGYVLVTNIIRWNNLRIEKGLSISSGIFRYDWRLIMQHTDNALFWSVLIYIFVFIPIQIVRNKKGQTGNAAAVENI